MIQLKKRLFIIKMETILITGSSRGIGKCLGLYLKTKGHNVIFNGTSEIPTFLNPGGYLCKDITTCSATEFLDSAVELFKKKPTVLVCNAGYLGKNTVEDKEERQKEIKVNLLANIDLIEEAAIRGIKKIIVITTNCDYNFGNDNLLNYAWTKEALSNFSMMTARKFYKNKISISNLCIDIPIKTDMTKGIDYGLPIKVEAQNPEIVIPCFVAILKENFMECTGQTYSLEKFRLNPRMEIKHPGSNSLIKNLGVLFEKFDDFENSANENQHLCMGHNCLGTKYPLQKKLIETEEHIERYLHTNSGNVTLMNGGITGCFDTIAKIFLNQGDEVIIVSQAFSFIYPILVQRGVNIKTIQNCFIHELYKNLTSKTKMVLITNPMSLIGTGINEHTINTILKKLPKHIIVVIDECYIEFSDNFLSPGCTLPSRKIFSTSDYLAMGHNEIPRVIGLRTFSKFFGLGDSRMGYIIADKFYSDLLKQTRLWKNFNEFGLQQIHKVLDNTERILSIKNHYITEKEIIYNELKKLELNFIPTQANFIVIQLKENWNFEELGGKLKENDIIIPNESLIWGTFIYAFGVKETNFRFLETLKNFDRALY
jgi:histidinol-phosphate aminotransferase